MGIGNVQIIKNDEGNEYAAMLYEEYLRIQEELGDYADLRCLREAKEAEKDASTIGMAELKKKIIAGYKGIEHGRYTSTS